MARYDKKSVKDAASGRWPEIISRLANVPEAILDGGHHPCPKCGGDNRFRFIDEDDGACLCNQCFKEKNGDGLSAVMWLTGWSFPKTLREVASYAGMDVEPSTPDESTAEIRHETYSEIARLFPLSAKHRSDMLARGITEGEIDLLGYWSAPAGGAIQLMTAFDSERRVKVSEAVPGIMPGGALTIAASNALMIPVRDRFGRVAAVQCRPDKPSNPKFKYFWLSSKDHGLSPGAPAHLSIAKSATPSDGKTVRLTEGPIKADIASYFSGIKTVAVAGVNNWRAGVDLICELKPEFVRLAFDADCSTNVAVAKATVEAYDELMKRGLLVQLESWNPEAKGIDDAIAAGVAVEALPIEETKRKIDRLRMVVADAQKVERIQNYRLTPGPPTKTGDPTWEKSPLPVPVIAKKLTDLQDGWPKSCGGILFVTNGNQIRELNSPHELFGWIAVRSPVDFHAGNGCIGKQEFFAELPYHVEQFEATESLPHFPPLPNCFYSHAAEPGSGKYLEQFLDFFSPATEFDRQLILAFIATTFWGGAPGRRVAFGVDSITGTGAGKSELVKRVASLTGGAYEFGSQDIKEENIRKALVNGQRFRVALMDNVKESCLSSAVIESLVTSPSLGGHKLHVGYNSRPNVITWAVTMNGMALSRDLAQRMVVIKMTQPNRSGTWDDDVDRFIVQHREDVVSDIAAFFQRPTTRLSRYTRWASWEVAILSRMENPTAMQKLIEQRSSDSDEDQSTAQSFCEYATEQLTSMGYDPLEDAIHIPSGVATHWMMEASGKDFTKRSAAAALKAMVDGGSLKNIKLNPSRKFGRGWVWNCASESPINYTLEKTIVAKNYRENSF